ncbi:MAG TPA: CHAT domain-containing tetratricopeptide repeat protein [Bryobacteraceae bacterium]|jgi:CHAT domain-containing protein
MRWRVLLLFCLAAACSRRPSASQAYAQAWTEFQHGRLPQAQKTVEAALQGRAAESVEALRLLEVEILLARGQYGKASSALAQVADPHEQPLHLRWLVDQADLLRRQNQTAKATALLDQVDGAAGDQGTGDPVFRSLLLRSAVLLRANRFDDAEAVLERLIPRTEKAGDTYNQASAWLNLCFSKLKRQNYDESIEYGMRALDLAEKMGALRVAATAHNNLGIVYTVFHDLDQAAQHTNQAITQFREVDDPGNLGDALGELGNIHLLGRHPELAVQDFRQGFDIAKGMEDVGSAVRWAGREAFAQMEQKHWEEAESWNQQALALRERLKDAGNDPYLQLNEAAIASGLGDSVTAERLYRELITDSKGVPYVEWDAHLRLGALYASQHKLPEANAQYVHGLEAIERVPDGFVKDEDRFTYYDLQMEFFQDYVDLLADEKDITGALKVAEYSRARILGQKLGIKPGTIDKVQTAAFERYAGRTKTVLLSYWLAPKRSFVWVIKANGIRMKELPPGDNIGEWIREYGRAIDQQGRDPVGQGLPQAERLEKALLGPLREELAGATRVVIVPDQEMHTLNLETLPAPADAKRYWIDDVELSVAPSLSVLAETAPAAAHPKPTMLLIGNPVPASPQYPALPSAKVEVEKIHGLFTNAVVLTGPDASPRSFFDAVRNPYSMIHFAAHAETNSQSPLESAVILSKSGDSYKLYARDVARMKLAADLVTISACRSAGAKAYGGEGLVGFAWAFLQSGAGAVIAGLWDVSDSSSSELMDKLYQGVAKGATPAAALREAKRTLLHSGGAFHRPFFWAPYQIYIR